MRYTWIFFFLLCFYSCKDSSKFDHKNNKQDVSITQISNVETIYKMVESINESKTKFGKDNFTKMGLLYKNKKVIEIIDKNAYSGLSDYFIVFFLEEPNFFYSILHDCKDEYIRNKIYLEIDMQIEITTGEGGMPNYRDSLYESHSSKYKNHLSIVNYIFNKK